VLTGHDTGRGRRDRRRLAEDLQADELSRTVDSGGAVPSVSVTPAQGPAPASNTTPPAPEVTACVNVMRDPARPDVAEVEHRLAETRRDRARDARDAEHGAVERRQPRGEGDRAVAVDCRGVRERDRPEVEPV
jgi:hypothetical protein